MQGGEHEIKVEIPRAAESPEPFNWRDFEQQVEGIERELVPIIDHRGVNMPPEQIQAHLAPPRPLTPTPDGPSPHWGYQHRNLPIDPEFSESINWRDFERQVEGIEREYESIIDHRGVSMPPEQIQAHLRPPRPLSPILEIPPSNWEINTAISP